MIIRREPNGIAFMVQGRAVEQINKAVGFDKTQMKVIKLIGERMCWVFAGEGSSNVFPEGIFHKVLQLGG